MKRLVLNVIRKFLILLFVYSVVRLIHYFYHIDDFLAVSRVELISAFLNGIRFDISGLLRVNGIFYLLWLLPLARLHEGVWAKTIRAIYVTVNFVFLSFNTADIELVNFNGQRLTRNYFLLLQDISNQAVQLLYHYWGLALLTIFGTFIIYFFDPRIQFGKIEESFVKKFTVIFFAIFFMAFGIRGGLQNKPLKTAHAYQYSQSELGTLALNSTFTVLTSQKAKIQSRFQFMSESEVLSLLPADLEDHFEGRADRPKHVMIFILESFAAEYVGASNGGVGFTPFFDELSRQGLYFKNAFANGRRSLEAVPSILASLPSLMNEPFLMSSFQGAKLIGLGDQFKKNGYWTAFFHGAENGSMFFDSFAARTGFEHYFGLNEYPNAQKDYDGFWGIADEPFFQFVVETVPAEIQPSIAVLFSLSSHQPYFVPEKYKGKFPKGTLEIHESIGYTDHSLRLMFESMKSKPWYNDTLFILTADHTQKSDRASYQDELGAYRVPLLVFYPRFKKPSDWPAVDLNRVAKHSDILPTVFDVMGLDRSKLLRSGQSLFSDPSKAIAVNHTPDGYWALTANHFLKLDSDLQATVFLRDGLKPIDLGDSKNSAALEDVKKFKAYLQYVVNGVIDNSLASAN